MACDAILAALRTVCASRRQGGAVVVLALKRKVNNRQQVNPFDFIGETERIRGIYSFTCTEHQQN
jgi:Zn-dependent alcohol dehydrogenase